MRETTDVTRASGTQVGKTKENKIKLIGTFSNDDNQPRHHKILPSNTKQNTLRQVT